MNNPVSHQNADFTGALEPTVVDPVAGRTALLPDWAFFRNPYEVAILGLVVLA